MQGIERTRRVWTTVATAGALILALFAAVPASGAPVTLVFDSFTDGGFDNGADAADTTWGGLRGGETLSILASTPWGSANGLRMGAAAGVQYQGVHGALPQVASLEYVGDKLSLNFVGSIVSTPQNSTVRFGFFNSEDKTAYGAWVGTNTTKTFGLRKDAGSSDGMPPLSGNGTVSMGTDGSLSSGLQATKFEIDFLLERVESGIKLTTQLNKVQTRTFTDTSNLFTTFDRIVIGLGSTSMSFVIDDVQVTWTSMAPPPPPVTHEPPTPEAIAAPLPAALPMAAAGLIAIAVRRRMRCRAEA